MATSLTFFGLDELLTEGKFGSIFSSKEMPVIPAGKFTQPIPGKWVAQQIGEMWYIELGGIDDWHDCMLAQLAVRVGEPQTGFADGMLFPNFLARRIEVRVGRNTASIPLEVCDAIAEEIFAAHSKKEKGVQKWKS